jgi:predicted HAD superfamily Cof-like phosphohydrolase
VDTELNDIREMNKKFGILLSDSPGHLSHRKMTERLGCLTEELAELTQAAARNDLAGMADALIDLVVFAKGTAVMMGLPWQELWDDVHRANMAKERGVGSRGYKVDLVKPPGWVGPRTTEILVKHGYDRETWFSAGATCGKFDVALHGGRDD